MPGQWNTHCGCGTEVPVADTPQDQEVVTSSPASSRPASPFSSFFYNNFVSINGSFKGVHFNKRCETVNGYLAVQPDVKLNAYSDYVLLKTLGA